MMAKNITECVVCCEEVEIIEEFNGEMMCQYCYHEPDNEVFTDE